jgi:hypothetical protein
MTPILDHIAASSRSGFRPSNPDEYFALRLAQKLGEPMAAAHYVSLMVQYPIPKLIAAFNRSTENNNHTVNLAHRFLDELLANGRNGLHLPTPMLAGIRIERRGVGAALFTGAHLESVRFRHLSSKPIKAEASASGFIRSLIQEFHIESAALETAPVHQEIQRAMLTQAVSRQLRADGTSIWEVSKQTVTAAMAHPPPRTRRKVREIIQQMWPQLSPKRGQVSALDAVALGLFVQTERLFNHFPSDL